MNRRAFIRNTALAGIAWNSKDPLSAAAEPEAGPLNVVYICGDDVRPDAFRALGNPAVATPAIDRLAARGCVFHRAACGYPLCVPSRTEMQTGRCHVGADLALSERFDPSWTTWAQAMRAAGWATSFSGKWDLKISPWQTGYATTAGLFSLGGAPAHFSTVHADANGRRVTGYTGFTFKTDSDRPIPELGVGLTPDTDAHIADQAIALIRRNASGRFFCHVNFTSSHDPRLWPRGLEHRFDYRALALPGNFRPEHLFETGNLQGRDEKIIPAPRSAEEVMKERAVYFACVENLDRQVGRIVRALEQDGLLARTLIIVTADHGLALGSHGLMGKQNQYEHTANVPLIMAGPRIPAGAHIRGQCCLRDLYPTVCEMTGVAVPSSVQGLSLAPLLRGERAEVHEAVFGYWRSTQRMMRTADGWKLTWYPAIGRNQLFHLPDDPLELRDLAQEPAQRGRVRAMRDKLGKWQRQHGDTAALSA